MLTPKDVHDVEFPRVLKGYSPKEVDAFLRKIVVEYEGILQENDDLQAQIRVLEEKVYEAAALQQGIRDALAKANELVDRRRVEAEEEAERILQKARHAAQLEEEHLRRVQEFSAGVKRRLRSLLMTNIALLDDDEEPHQPPRRPGFSAERSSSSSAPARSEGGHGDPAYDDRSERDYRDWDDGARGEEIVTDDEFEKTRVFTMPPGARDRSEGETGGDGPEPGRATTAVENGHDEVAASEELGRRPYGAPYEEEGEYGYDEERELEARWARRLRQNREGTSADAEDDD